MIVTPFVAIPRTIANDASLPPGARTLWTILKDHARQRSSCYPGYRRLCAILKASEKTVRRWMRALIEAGYVMQTRRGHMRSNLYTLTPFTHVSTAETGILERELFPPIKTESFQDSSKENVSSSTPTPLSLPPEPEPARVEPLPADVTALVADISREMRDTAPRSSRTRVARMIAASDAPMDMYKAVQQARATTRRRLSRIRKRASSGQAAPMPYFLSVLARAIGVVPVADIVPMKHPVRPATPVSGEGEVITPPVAVAVPVVRADRAIFWGEMHAATGIGDLREYCRVVGRPPVYDDPRRSVSLAKEKLRR